MYQKGTARVTEPTAALTAVKEFVFADEIRIPASFPDFESFREWCRSDEYPEFGDVFWIDGTIWVNLSMDEINYHNLVKSEILRVLANLNRESRAGYCYADRARLVERGAGLSVEPDFFFVSKKSLASGAVRKVAGVHGGVVEMEGAADMVTEVISRSSEKVDTVTLREQYYKAGVAEYWLVDARREPLKFDILRRGPKGFVPVRKSQGWLRSEVFDRRFRLRVETDENDIPEYTLDVE